MRFSIRYLFFSPLIFRIYCDSWELNNLGVSVVWVSLSYNPVEVIRSHFNCYLELKKKEKKRERGKKEAGTVFLDLGVKRACMKRAKNNGA